MSAEMADHDYALGRVVERIAHSRVAGDTVMFVVEDDAQNGADHVDARRSLALIMGAGVRQGALVRTRYTTVNVLRTIDELPDLPALGRNDGLATPMADLFDPEAGACSFLAEAASVLRGIRLPIGADRFAAGPACARRTAT